MSVGLDDDLADAEGLAAEADDGPSPRREDPRSAVVRGLRLPGSETQLTQFLAAVLSAEPEWAKSAYVDAGTVPVEGGGLGRIFARLRLSETGPVEVEFGVASWEEIYVFAELSRLPTRKTLQDAPATTRALVDRLFAREFSLTNPRRPVRATWGITPARLASHDLPGDAAAWIVERLSAAHMAGAFDAPATGG